MGFVKHNLKSKFELLMYFVLFFFCFTIIIALQCVIEHKKGTRHIKNEIFFS